ncbi:NAD(P)/FAD-dependent oxidoreductase [Sporofaciens sp. SGI.106]|uniref:NAD(P)/FAD-dependent oxidoreductase n=1 Tax=Sporofaciens sp. SGI.106 TaxID=3420568 RepID=UPI002A95681C|nr:aminoacetone oxidase family FAD-binding enzyme [Lachnoclostridium sp.]
MKRICIIGGGASGMAAAIAAARKGAKVTVLEHKDRLGKKILSTGNGRCNLTNEFLPEGCYRGEDETFASEVLKLFTPADAISFFESIGILTKSRDGYIYPRNGQAACVRDSLEKEMERCGVKWYVNTEVESIHPDKGGFRIEVQRRIEDSSRVTECFPGSKKGRKQGKKQEKIFRILPETYRADIVILAAGGQAAPVLGSDGSGYKLAQSLGHSLTLVVPALVQLRAEDSCFKQLAGVRADAGVKLYVDDEWKASDVGEVQLTDYGISGIPVFQVSRYAAFGIACEQRVRAEIDFLPYVTDTEFLKLLKNRGHQWQDSPVEDLINGIFHSKLLPVLLERAGISCGTPARNVQDETWKSLVEICKKFQVKIVGTNSFEQAQVCAGGVRTSEVDAFSMASRICNGLYLTGELLDVDGICGGYNLQWAWATGVIAGEHAALR